MLPLSDTTHRVEGCVILSMVGLFLLVLSWQCLDKPLKILFLKQSPIAKFNGGEKPAAYVSVKGTASDPQHLERFVNR